MRMLGTALAAATLLVGAVGCGDHGDHAGTGSPGSGSTSNAAAADEALLKSIAQLFVNELFTGQSSDGFGLVSKRCQAKIGAVSFGALVERLSESTGSPMRFKTFHATIRGDRAVAAYTFSDHRFNTTKDRWVRETDGWRWDSCSNASSSS
jgi:hypothetical protein